MYLVCGEALFDFFLDEGSDPGAVRFDARAGGSPFNVAIGVCRLGGQAALLTGISNDMLGERLVSVLKRESVSRDYLLRSGRRTTISLVGVNAEGHPGYVFYGLGSADCSVTTEDLPSIGSEITGLHFGSYSLVVQPVADAFASLLARAGGRFISLDPNVRTSVEPDLDIWRERVAEYAGWADLIKISMEDLTTLYPGTPPETKAAEWLAGGTQLVVITDGGRAVTARTRSGVELRVEPRGFDVVDTVGAGDSFQAALLARIANDGNPQSVAAALDEERLRELITFAINAAAVTCSRRGADLPRLDEVRDT